MRMLNRQISQTPILVLSFMLLYALLPVELVQADGKTAVIRVGRYW